MSPVPAASPWAVGEVDAVRRAGDDEEQEQVEALRERR